MASAIESALSQTYSNREVIVIDDGSSDDTTDVASRYAGRGVKLIRQPNGGLSSARNTGITASSGDWLLFLDADDLLDDDFVELAIRATTDDCALVHGSWRVMQAGQVVSEHHAKSLGNDAFHSLIPGNFTPIHTVLVRRSALDQAGHFEPSLRAVEDWDLWLRVAAAGRAFIACPDAWVSYVRTSDSMSSNATRMALASLQVVERAKRLHSDCDECQRRIKSSRWEYRHRLWRAFTHDGSSARRNIARRILGAFAGGLLSGHPAIILVPLRYRLQQLRHGQGKCYNSNI